MTRNRIFALLLSLTALQSCTTAQQSELDTKVAALTPCEKVKALIAGHKKGFPQLRMTQTTSRYMDMWKARYHLVGDSCQVWGWGEGKFSYVCSLTEPNKDVAMEHYSKARDATHQCLGEQWVAQEGSRKQGEGIKAEYRMDGDSTMVTIVAASSPTLFESEWKTYFFVGDEADLKR